MDKVYSISEFAERVNVSMSTLRRWDASGEFPAKKRPSGHRYYDESDVRKLLNLTPEEMRKVIVYCRVSSHSQKDDLASQIESMEAYCLSAGIAVDEWVKEIGGGMNFKRKKFLALMDAIVAGEVKRLIIAHKDRLVRFGFDFIQHLADRHGCEIEVVNQESLSPQEEMTEDLLAIVHTFSCRLYGMRKYRKDTE
jgi:predicted site-specific integrase-resolvase